MAPTSWACFALYAELHVIMLFSIAIKAIFPARVAADATSR